ncbi:putative Fe-S cluster assembly protein dre2 [Venustampulla echinocandica]|uniref:Putative Fe-S cluster assembly protein dre2 n=1 Tax=Venustampulla echinocandica TaxID=2656787 RepID=A0A370TQX4_9HELO|nr:putative Fe-S cluster assembly protein dre2 [Venustampulla echinocandica]RDL37935.1 putative Fe-S cluster assembly protein dre2 [Venustampulla echinocandica]
MAYSITIDNASDFNPIATNPSPKAPPSALNARTLLLAPPSIASHEELLRNVLSSYDRSITDLQMLDRLAAGFVTLPDSTYDLILILTDADGSRNESAQLLGRDVFGRIVRALKAGGKLHSQDGTFGQDPASADLREAILAGLVAGEGGMAKPDYSAGDAVPLKLRRKDKGAAISKAEPAVTVTAVPLNGKLENGVASQNKPAGVGFVDFSDDFGDVLITGEDDDDELIDEDTLLTEEDLMRPINIPPECAPRAGKRRRACKDCTCGLTERLAAEDEAKRSKADSQLKSLKLESVMLESDDLAELDFTVKGKVGSCGNCSLGDAFRCDGCPYIGMPAFSVGQEVRLLNDDIQL